MDRKDQKFKELIFKMKQIEIELACTNAERETYIKCNINVKELLLI